MDPQGRWVRMAILDHVVVPIASEEDAEATTRALQSLLAEIQCVTAVHVIEKGGGTIDKAPMEKRREDAVDFLDHFETVLSEGVIVETRIEFGTDVVETIVETALDAGGTSIAIRPRGGSRIVRLLSGDTASRLVTNPTIPVLVLPDNVEE